jgi:hypothetical protein
MKRIILILGLISISTSHAFFEKIRNIFFKNNTTQEKVVSAPLSPSDGRVMISEISEKGRNLMEKLEGFKRFPYKDGLSSKGVQLWSIGYGHQISKNDEVFTALGIIRSSLDKGITKEEGDAIFREDLKRFSIKNLVMVPLYQYEYDSLSSFCYNLGHLQFSKTAALREVNAREYLRAPDSIGRFINFGGKLFLPMVKRRCIEIMVYLEKCFDPREIPSRFVNLDIPDVDDDWKRLSPELRLDAIQMYRIYKGN